MTRIVFISLYGVCAAIVGMSCMAQPARAATYYWTTASGSIQPGSGPWDSTSSDWATDTTGATVSLWVPGSNANFYANSTPTSTITVSGSQSVGNITFDGSGYTLSGGTIILSGGTVAANQDATIGSVIGGTGGITTSGPGVLVLNNVNTYTGGTTVNGGTLVLNSNPGDTGTGTVRGVLNINFGATVELNMPDAIGYGSNSVSAVNIVGGVINNATASDKAYTTNFFLTGGTMSGGKTYDFTDGYGITTYASTVTSVISANIAIRDSNNLVFNVASGTTPSGIDLNVSGLIDAWNLGYGITKSGAGLMELTNINTYTGTTYITGGTLQLGDGVANIGSVYGPIVDNALLVLANPIAQTYSGVISGSGSVTKAATGTLTLTASNIYSGGTTVSGGTLVLSYGSGSGYGTIIGTLNINPGATVVLNSQDALGWRRPGTQVSNVNIDGGVIYNAGNTQAYTTNFYLTGGTMSGSNGAYQFTNGYGVTTFASTATSLISGDVNLRDGNNMVFNVASGTTSSGIDLNVSGAISQWSTAGITKSGAGVMELSNNNTYAGGTVINGGTLQIASVNSLGTGGGTVTIGNGNLQVLASAPAGAIAGPVVLNGSGAIQVNSAAPIVLAGAVTGNGGPLTKNGSGSLALQNYAGNTYSHGTVINDGKVIAYGGGALGSGPVTLNNGTAIDSRRDRRHKFGRIR